MNAGVCEAGARAALYRAVEETVRPALGLDAPIRWPALRQSLRGRIDLIEHHFDSDRILGVLVRGVGDGRSAIVLRADRSETSRKFILCHELIHYFLHPGRERTLCRADRQEDILEWQANEGAAQLLVPWQDFLPRVGACRSALRTDKAEVFAELAALYAVSGQTIRFRIATLADEIDQYLRGVPLEAIQLCSRRELRRMGRLPRPICDIEGTGNRVDIFCEEPGHGKTGRREIPYR